MQPPHLIISKLKYMTCFGLGFNTPIRLKQQHLTQTTRKDQHTNYNLAIQSLLQEDLHNLSDKALYYIFVSRLYMWGAQVCIHNKD